MKSDKPYVMGDDSDECEEEVDDDSEIDELYNEGVNEYETEEQWEQTKAAKDESVVWVSSDEEDLDIEGGGGEGEGEVEVEGTVIEISSAEENELEENELEENELEE